jgi:hypothetical protein
MSSSRLASTCTILKFWSICGIEQTANVESSPLDLFHRLSCQSLLLLGVCNSKLPYGCFDRLLGIRSFNVADQGSRRGADAGDSPLVHFCAGTLRHGPRYTKPLGIIRAAVSRLSPVRLARQAEKSRRDSKALPESAADLRSQRGSAQTAKVRHEQHCPRWSRRSQQIEALS